MTSTKRIYLANEPTRFDGRVDRDGSDARFGRSRDAPPGARGRREEKKNMRVIASDERRAPDIARASDIGRIGCTIRRRVEQRYPIDHSSSIDRSRVGGNARRRKYASRR